MKLNFCPRLSSMRLRLWSRITLAGLLGPLILLLVIGDKLNYNQNQDEGAGRMVASAIPFNAIVPNLSTGWFHKPGPAESIFFGLIVLKVIALRMAGVFPYNLNELLQDGSYFDKYIGNPWGSDPAPLTNEISDIADKKQLKRASGELVDDVGARAGSAGTNKKLKRKQRDLFFMDQWQGIGQKKLPSSVTSALGPFAKLLTPAGHKFGMSKAKFGQKKAAGFSKAPLLKEIDTIERVLLGLRRIDSHDCFIRHVCQINQNRLAGNGSPFDEAVLKVFHLKPQSTTTPESNAINPSIWDIYHDALVPSVIDCGQKYQLCPLSQQEMDPSSLLGGLF